MLHHYNFTLDHSFRRSVLCLFFVCISLVSKGQNPPELTWLDHIYGPATDQVTDVTADPSGNIFTTGYFKTGNLDFDPGPGTYNLTSYYFNSAFLMKQDPAGQLLWAIKAGGTNMRAEGHQVITDHEGNVYYSGRFSSIVDFDPSPGTFNLSSLSFDPYTIKDVFVVKLDPDGNFIWARRFGETFSYITRYNLVVEPFENVYLAGNFNGTMDFNPSSAYDTIKSSKGNSFLVKLNKNGNFVRLIQLRTTATNITTRGATDRYGNVYVSGAFSGLVDFDPGPLNFNMFSVSSRDDFIMKIDSAGIFKWARQFSTNLPTEDFYMATDTFGFVYKVGLFKGIADFNPGPLMFKINAEGPTNIYLMKLDPFGNFQWAKRLGSGDENVNRIWTDSKRNLYMTGTFLNFLEFGQGLTILNSTQPYPNRATFIARYDSEGKFRWGIQPGDGSRKVELRSGFTDMHMNVITTGTFRDTVDFAPGLPDSLVIADSVDIYIQKLYQCTPHDSIQTVDACFTYELNNQSYHNSGTYQQFLTSSEGCDSTLTIHLTIYTVDAGVHLSGITLIANDTGMNYQWVDCANAFAPVSGATGASFTPAVNGQYALIASVNGCSDTSACYAITTVGIPENITKKGMTIFPNPTHGFFAINPGITCNEAEIEVRDICGNLKFKKLLQRSEFDKLYLDGPAGIYFFRLTTKDESWVVKVVKVM